MRWAMRLIFGVGLLALACTAVPMATTAAPATATPGPTLPASAAPAASPTPFPTATIARGRVQVSVDDNYYAPQDLVVAVGTEVVWLMVADEGELPHDVVSFDGSFKSGTLNYRDTFAHVFTRPGEFPYVCSFHIREGMTGKVVVR